MKLRTLALIASAMVLVALLAGCGGATQTVTVTAPAPRLAAPTPAPVPVQAVCVPSTGPSVGTACRPDGHAPTPLVGPPELLPGLIAPGLDAQGARLIEEFEGYSRCAYWDGYGGVWTVGFGQTRLPNGHSVYGGFCFASFAAAQNNLITSVNREYLWAVREACGSACGQHQVNGLVSFDYNLGAYIFRNVPSLKAAIHRGDFGTACAIMRHYAYAGGQYLPGLARRRALECVEILRPSETPAQQRARLHRERVARLHADYRSRSALRHVIAHYRCSGGYDHKRRDVKRKCTIWRTRGARVNRDISRLHRLGIG